MFKKWFGKKKNGGDGGHGHRTDYLLPLDRSSITALAHLLYRPPRPGPPGDAWAPESMSPRWLEKQKREVDGLPRELQLPRGSAVAACFLLPIKAHPGPGLCDAHELLDPRLVHWLFHMLTKECTTHADRARDYRRTLPAARDCPASVAGLLDRFDGVASLYRPARECDAIPADARFREVRSGCHACVLAAVGARPYLLADLRANMCARARAGSPRALPLVEAWLDGFGRDGARDLRARADALADELRAVRRLARHGRSRRTLAELGPRAPEAQERRRARARAGRHGRENRSHRGGGGGDDGDGDGARSRSRRSARRGSEPGPDGAGARPVVVLDSEDHEEKQRRPDVFAFEESGASEDSDQEEGGEDAVREPEAVGTQPRRRPSDGASSQASSALFHLLMTDVQQPLRGPGPDGYGPGRDHPSLDRGRSATDMPPSYTARPDLTSRDQHQADDARIRPSSFRPLSSSSHYSNELPAQPHPVPTTTTPPPPPSYSPPSSFSSPSSRTTDRSTGGSLGAQGSAARVLRRRLRSLETLGPDDSVSVAAGARGCEDGVRARSRQGQGWQETTTSRAGPAASGGGSAAGTTWEFFMYR